MVGQSAKPRVVVDYNEKHYTQQRDCAKQRKHLRLLPEARSVDWPAVHTRDDKQRIL
jgi:hypothetical protein